MKPPEVRLTVESAGLLSTVQDLGRFGRRRYGISVCGALEGDHLRLANAAVGNGADAAALELSGGRFRLELEQFTWACWMGGGNASLEQGRPERIRAFEATGRGLLALGGGIDVPEVQGSRSTDLRAGFGGFKGRALRRGDVLFLGTPYPDPRALDPRALDPRALDPQTLPSRATSPRWRIPAFTLHGAVRVMRGPEWELLTPTAQLSLEQMVFRVSMQSNRMGLRLDGAALEHDRSFQMRSGAVLPGVVQLPPGGQPIVLLQDAGTVGGYPRVLIVAAVDLPRVAVLPPGTAVSLRLVSNEEALVALVEQKHTLERLLHSIALRRTMKLG